MQNVSNDFKTSAKEEEFPTHKEYLLLQNYASNKQFGTTILASSEEAGFEDDYIIDGKRNHEHFWQSKETVREYVRPINIIYSGDALSDYQIMVKLTMDNFNYNKVDANGYCIKFYDSNDVTPLSFWRESWNTSGDSIFWIKIPSITENKTIYLHYKKSGWADDSNGDNTFILFDQFEGSSIDTNKWTIGGSPTVANSEVYLGVGGSLSTENKKTGSGPLISHFCIRAQANDDTNFRFRETNSDQICLGKTTYSGLGVWTSGTGRYNLSQTGHGDNTNNKRDYILKIYGTTLDYWQSSGIEGKRTMPNSVDGRTFYFYLCGGGSNYPGRWVDYVFVRKYASTEPTNSVGSESVYNGHYQLLTATFSLSKKIGLVKLFSYPIDGAIKKFKFQYYDGSAYQDITPLKIWGMNRNNNPAPSVSNSGAEITTNASLNYIMFSEVETEKLRLIIIDTIVPDDYARICEMEVYRYIDITEYLYQTLSVSRQMDATWNRFQGGTFQLQLFNESRKFSTEYAPTPTEVASGYFNSELLPNCQLLAFSGFNNENIQMIEGWIDTIQNDSETRIATLSGRDKFKLLNLKDKIIINQSDVATKTIENCIEYVCNECNISSSELFLSTSNITLDYFMNKDKSASDLIYDLLQAMGNAMMVINENGQLQTRFLTNERSWIQTSQNDFEKGIKNQTDITSVNGSVILECEGEDIPNNDFEQGWNSWTGYGYSNGNKHWVGGTFAGRDPYHGSYQAICESNVHGELSEGNMNGYVVAHHCWLIDADTGQTLYDSGRIARDMGGQWYEEKRALNWDYNVADNVYFCYRRGCVGWTDRSFSTSAWKNRKVKIKIHMDIGSADGGQFDVGWVESAPFFCSGTTIYWRAYGNIWKVRNMAMEWVGGMGTFYADYIQGGKRKYLTSGDFTSQSLDTKIASPIWGKLETISNIPDGTTITIKTQTSSDNTNWDAETGLDENGNIQSASKRYLKWKAYFTTTNTEITARLDEVVVRWKVGAESGGLPTEECIRFIAEGMDGYPENEQGSLKSFSLQKSDQQGGEHAIYNKVFVKANPLFQSSSATDNQWYCGSYQYQAGTYTLWADLENTIKLDNSAKLYITDSAGQKTITYPSTSIAINNGTASIVWSNTKCKITLVMTATETISEMKIQAYYYTTFGAIEREAIASEYNKSIEKYGERFLSVDNNFIQSQTTAQDIANALIIRFQNLTAKVNEIEVYFAPHLQMYDRVKIVDYHTGINANDFYIVGISHSLQTGKSGTSLALTKL